MRVIFPDRLDACNTYQEGKALPTEPIRHGVIVWCHSKLLVSAGDVVLW